MEYIKDATFTHRTKQMMQQKKIQQISKQFIHICNRSLEQHFVYAICTRARHLNDI